jgi:Uma2 family endonuclease
MMVAMGTTKTLLTFEEFERLPDQPGKRELLKGELIELPPAESRHNRIAQRIYRALDTAIDEIHRRGQALELGEAFHEMGYQLAAECWVQPDASISHAGQIEGKYIEGAPAIAVEVISPGNSAEDLDTKTALYFEFGAIEVWLVYPKTRHVDVHVPGRVQVVNADSAITTPLLPGFSMPVKEILGE